MEHSGIPIQRFKMVNMYHRVIQSVMFYIMLKLNPVMQVFHRIAAFNKVHVAYSQIQRLILRYLSFPYCFGN
jgi:hypothetical protein